MEDVVVTGAGIVGLATARALLRTRPGLSVTVLDKADDVATAQTGHNSGVIHAGIYYAPDSLKARLCGMGEAVTKDFCDEHETPYAVPGKLVVATRLAVRSVVEGPTAVHVQSDTGELSAPCWSPAPGSRQTGSPGWAVSRLTSGSCPSAGSTTSCQQPRATWSPT